MNLPVRSLADLSPTVTISDLVPLAGMCFAVASIGPIHHNVWSAGSIADARGLRYGPVAAEPAELARTVE
jgi:hypothetical protein